MDGIKTIEKWKNWLKRIKVEAQNLVMYRSMFKDVIEIINANTELHEDNHFYRYMNDSHIALIVMGLRRQIKNDKQSISLVRLITEISEAPHLMSRENYTELYSDSSIAFLADEHLMKQEKFEQAENWLKKAAQASPDFIGVHHAGYLLAKAQNNEDQAAQSLDKVRNLLKSRTIRQWHINEMNLPDSVGGE